MMHHTRAHMWRDMGKGGHPCPPSPPLRPLGEVLESVIDRLGRLSPSHRDPERFHMDKAELVGELRRLARAMGRMA